MVSAGVRGWAARRCQAVCDYRLCLEHHLDVAGRLVHAQSKRGLNKAARQKAERRGEDAMSDAEAVLSSGRWVMGVGREHRALHGLSGQALPGLVMLDQALPTPIALTEPIRAALAAEEHPAAARASQKEQQALRDGAPAAVARYEERQARHDAERGEDAAELLAELAESLTLGISFQRPPSSGVLAVSSGVAFDVETAADVTTGTALVELRHLVRKDAINGHFLEMRTELAIADGCFIRLYSEIRRGHSHASRKKQKRAGGHVRP